MSTNKKRGPFEIIRSRVVYRNPWIRVTENLVIRPGGSEGIFGIVDMKAGVSVLPIYDDGCVGLASEFKYAVGRNTIEVFSGGIDDGEEPLDAAKRELKEELGGDAQVWEYLGCVDPFTTIVNSPNHMFIAKELSISDTQNMDDGEIVTMIKVPFEEALAKVQDGVITHAASCVTILKAALARK